MDLIWLTHPVAVTIIGCFISFLAFLYSMFKKDKSANKKDADEINKKDTDEIKNKEKEKRLLELEKCLDSLKHKIHEIETSLERDKEEFKEDIKDLKQTMHTLLEKFIDFIQKT